MAKKNAASAQFNLRLNKGGIKAIGPGKIALLEAIDETGSISAAARQLGMSYRRAWGLVSELNQVLAKPAVEANVGGTHGGRATLLPTGRKLATLYRAVERDAARHTASATRTLLSLLAK
jgi:molybdate transport system regulatory protein